MGPEIIIPIAILAVVVPIGFSWAKKNFKDNPSTGVDDGFVAPSDRLTSNALRDLESPPWRVVYEVAHDRLSGVGHVLIGPAGVFALRTTMDTFPTPPEGEPDARAVAEAAITRGGVDDALRRCAMSTDQLVWVHWGVNETSDIAIELMPGVTAVDGRELATWAGGRDGSALSASQVDLAWQTVVTAIGRPDPLA